ncbi:MAG TPA: SPOR domain-containing protein [Terracidiphilus sp.]|jgi:cell division septation protein DedD
MRGVFDDRKVEQAEPPPETELTLGSTTLLFIFFGLVLICGLCFGWGYAVGRHGSQEPSQGVQLGAGGQTTLQGGSSRPKPSATAQVGAAATQRSAAAEQVDDSAPSPGSNTSADASSQSPAPAVAAGQSNGPPQVRPALAPMANPAQPVQPGGMVAPALAAAGSLMVQIAAVSHPEDADVLMTALRKRGYAVTAHRDAADGLIHVRMGPFNSRDEAEKWRQKLLSDGYNAIVQP